MSEEARQGRTILLAFLVGMVLMSAFVIGFYISVKGTGKLPTQIVRFCLTLGLCYWVYRGSVIAKWILVVLALLAGLTAKVFGALIDPLWAALLFGVMGYLYLAIFTLLVKNSSVNAFLAYQRGEPAGSSELSDDDFID